jgi:hypothetical protein
MHNKVDKLGIQQTRLVLDQAEFDSISTVKANFDSAESHTMRNQILLSLRLKPLSLRLSRI